MHVLQQPVGGTNWAYSSKSPAYAQPPRYVLTRIMLSAACLLTTRRQRQGTRQGSEEAWQQAAAEGWQERQREKASQQHTVSCCCCRCRSRCKKEAEEEQKQHSCACIGCSLVRGVDTTCQKAIAFAAVAIVLAFAATAGYWRRRRSCDNWQQCGATGRAQQYGSGTGVPSSLMHCDVAVLDCKTSFLGNHCHPALRLSHPAVHVPSGAVKSMY